MKTLAKIAGCVIAYLIVVDMVGALVSLFFEIVPLLGVSGPLFYAIWFVAGAFCGFFTYNTAGELASPKQGSEDGAKASSQDWSSREDAGKTGLMVIAIMTAILIALSVLFYRLWWQYGDGSSNYVPDSEPLTLVFFITAFAAAIFAHVSLRPKPIKTA